jgi:RNA polymerase sigma-70 factor (ECF subfamily)
MRSEEAIAPTPETPAAQAIPALVEMYGDKLYRLGLHQCGSADEAHDLVQDIFTTAWRKWNQFEGRSEPSSWLYTIAVRICRRRHRLRAGEPRRLVPLEELLPDHGRPMAVVPEPSDPLADAIRREARETVDRGIARLPVHYRLPLLLKEIAELPIEEVSRILGLKEATVKTRLHRARLLLRKELEEVLPKSDLPAPDHARTICLDLLRAKQEALDHGVPFPVPDAELCSRCRALFDTLDLTQACVQIRRGEGLPDGVRQLILRAAGSPA